VEAAVAGHQKHVAVLAQLERAVYGPALETSLRTSDQVWSQAALR
jgi:hypothetical protein